MICVQPVLTDWLLLPPCLLLCFLCYLGLWSGVLLYVGSPGCPCTRVPDSPGTVTGWKGVRTVSLMGGVSMSLPQGPVSFTEWTRTINRRTRTDRRALRSHHFPALWLGTRRSDPRRLFPHLSDGDLHRHGLASWVSSAHRLRFSFICLVTMDDAEGRSVNEADSTEKGKWNHGLFLIHDFALSSEFILWMLIPHGH